MHMHSAKCMRAIESALASRCGLVADSERNPKVRIWQLINDTTKG